MTSETGAGVRVDRCPGCDSPDRRLWAHDRNRREGLPAEGDYWRCERCRTLYLSPIPPLDEAVRMYEESHRPPATPGHGLTAFAGDTARKVADTWARLWSPAMRMRGEPVEDGHGRSLLSIGCGYGEALQKYVDRGWEVHGVDPDQSAIAWARDHVEGTFTVGTFEEAAFDRRFDYIHSSAVIEHCYDPLAFLLKARDLLNPGGRLIFLTPNAGSAMTRLLRQYSIACWVPFHVVLFTPNGLRALAERAGIDAHVRTIADPHLASLSIRQWRKRSEPSFRLAKGWDTTTTTVLLAPVWALLNQVGWGEEVALLATKRDEASGDT